MSQLSLCLHIFIVMWLLNLVSRTTVGLLRKSKPPRWMFVGTLFLTMAILLCLFWMFCGYLVERLTGI